MSEVVALAHSCVAHVAVETLECIQALSNYAPLNYNTPAETERLSPADRLQAVLVRKNPLQEFR